MLLAHGGVICFGFLGLIAVPLSFLFSWGWYGSGFGRGLRLYVALFYTLVAGVVLLVWVDPISAQAFWRDIADVVFYFTLSGPIVAILLPVGYRSPGPADREALCYCGYNLRGNISGHCPECGRDVRDIKSHESADSYGQRPEPTAILPFLIAVFLFIMITVGIGIWMTFQSKR